MLTRETDFKRRGFNSPSSEGSPKTSLQGKVSAGGTDGRTESMRTVVRGRNKKETSWSAFDA